MDDGEGGAFIDLFGALSNSLATSATTSNVVKGLTYMFRYRASNTYGWGPWSPATTALAADPPAPPAAPALSAASDASVTLVLAPSLDNGGSQILGYELWMNQGVVGSAFS
jgi:hypothetical protein